MMGEHDSLRVYWQPGCSSCLQAKEFLARHGVAFESVNVLADGQAQAEMRALGARSVPVVARGREFVAGQNLAELAAFVGVAAGPVALAPELIARRIDELLSLAQRQLAAMPRDARQIELRPGRSLADLGYHVFAVVQGFLDSALGGELTEGYFTRVPESSWSLQRIADAGASVQAEFRQWQETHWDASLSLATYYGPQSTAQLLERTAWHVAQHLRQIAAVLETTPAGSPCPVPDELLRGLPLPHGIWDDEQTLDPKRIAT